MPQKFPGWRCRLRGDGNVERQLFQTDPGTEWVEREALPKTEAQPERITDLTPPSRNKVGRPRKVSA